MCDLVAVKRIQCAFTEDCVCFFIINSIFNVYKSPCIAAVATNLIIFRYISKPTYRLEKAAALKPIVSIMGTVFGTPLSSDLGQKISDSCLVPYARHIKKMTAQVSS